MPRITSEIAYDGASERVNRLRLAPLLDDVRSLLTSFTLPIKGERNANIASTIRKMIDGQFEAARGWGRGQAGGAGWIKRIVLNECNVCMGVEILFSARADLAVVGLMHLRKSIFQGTIDVGIIIVPDNQLSVFLTGRAPNLEEVLKYVVDMGVAHLPLIVIALGPDSAGAALAKQSKMRRKTQALRTARRREPLGETGKKLQVIRAAARHAYPTGDIDQMIAEIERG